MQARLNHDHEASCACVAEHRPPVLEYEWHHVHPIGLGGDPTPVGVAGENGVWICPTTHTNTHELMRLMFKAGRSLTDSELSATEERPVSRYAAHLARLGYERATAKE